MITAFRTIDIYLVFTVREKAKAVAKILNRFPIPIRFIPKKAAQFGLSKWSDSRGSRVEEGIPTLRNELKLTSSDLLLLLCDVKMGSGKLFTFVERSLVVSLWATAHITDQCRQKNQLATVLLGAGLLADGKTGPFTFGQSLEFPLENIGKFVQQSQWSMGEDLLTICKRLLTGETNPNNNHLIIFVHGIESRGEWIEDKAMPYFDGRGFKTEKRSPGFTSVVEFVKGKKSGLQNEQAEKLVSHINTVRGTHPLPGKISIIAHSNGALAVCNALKKIMATNSRLDLEALILVGAVVQEDILWDDYLPRRARNGVGVEIQRVLNFMGEKDLWPAMAKWQVEGTGALGSFGFLNQPQGVKQYRLSGADHSEIVKSQDAMKIWELSLLGHDIPKGCDSKTYWLLNWYRFSPILRKIFVSIGCLSLACLGWLFYTVLIQ